MSFSADQRVTFMETVASSGVPMERAMVGRAPHPRGRRRLMRCAFDCGFAGHAHMPPFFFRDAGDDGVVGFFDGLLGRTGARPKAFCSTIFRDEWDRVPRGLVDRLLREFPVSSPA